nr:MAG TPA: hypothetical protein [Caudoviricetes sp.]
MIMKKKKSMAKRIEKFEQKQRAKQEERANRIIEMKRAGDKEALAKEVRLMNKRINERFRQIERKNKHPEKTTGYMYAQRELGSEKPRYTESVKKLMEEDINTLYEQALGVSRKLGSKSTSLSGLKYINEKRVQGSIEGIKKNLGIDIEDSKEFRRFLEENVNEMIDNNIGSDVIFELFSMSMHKEKGFETLDKMWKEYQSRGERIDTIEMKNWLK